MKRFLSRLLYHSAPEPEAPLELNLLACRLNGVGLGEPAAYLAWLGGADDAELEREGVLCYFRHGLLVHLEDGYTRGYTALWEAQEARAAMQPFRGLCLYGDALLPLNPQSREEDVIHLFGWPHERDIDDEGIHLLYDLDDADLIMEVNLTPRSRLESIYVGLL